MGSRAQGDICRQITQEFRRQDKTHTHSPCSAFCISERSMVCRPKTYLAYVSRWHVAVTWSVCAGPRNAGPRTGGIPPIPSIGTDDLHPPMPGIPREFPGPDNIPYPGGVPCPLSFKPTHAQQLLCLKCCLEGF